MIKLTIFTAMLLSSTVALACLGGMRKVGKYSLHSNIVYASGQRLPSSEVEESQRNRRLNELVTEEQGLKIEIIYVKTVPSDTKSIVGTFYRVTENGQFKVIQVRSNINESGAVSRSLAGPPSADETYGCGGGSDEGPRDSVGGGRPNDSKGAP